MKRMLVGMEIKQENTVRDGCYSNVQRMANTSEDAVEIVKYINREV